MIRTNEHKLVTISVQGEVLSAMASMPPYRATHDGKVVVLPSTGGITYNLKVGDCCAGWQADHVEPCVTAKNLNANVAMNAAFNVLSCAGNEATVITGEAKRAKGTVTGKHGGAEHVLIDFDDRALAKMQIGDKIGVKAVGVGLEFPDYPEVKVMSMSPILCKKIPFQENRKSGVLGIPVTHKVPAAIMGSGLGSSDCHTGDYDIQLFDKEMVRKYGLQNLRFGDFVAIMDADHSYGRIYMGGAVSVGVVVHSDCVISGHGPGVMTLFTSAKGRIRPIVSPNANIGFYLKIGRFRRR
jgi:hypothetical protein